jgi:hypothetical protein
LHSLLKEIQEWMAVIWPMLPHSSSVRRLLPTQEGLVAHETVRGTCDVPGVGSSMGNVVIEVAEDPVAESKTPTKAISVSSQREPVLN